MISRKPEPARAWDHPERTYRWTDAELDWIAKRDAQWAAWGYSLAPLTPTPPLKRRPAYIRLRIRAKRALEWVRFGKIRVEMRSAGDGEPSEIAFLGRGGKLIGYWAQGCYDPSLPYRG